MILISLYDTIKQVQNKSNFGKKNKQLSLYK